MPIPVLRAAALALPLLMQAGPALAQNTTQAQTAPAVPDFSPERYMGTWYVIARLDHPFERGLTRETSTRTMAGDGRFEVVNKGVDKASGQMREVKATGRVVENTGSPTLAIAYGPREYTYQVLDWAPDSTYALVGSTDRDTLWVFAREPRLGPDVMERLKARALSAGYPVEQLMMVEHGS